MRNASGQGPTRPLPDLPPQAQLLEGVRQRQWRELITRLPTVFGAMAVLGLTYVYIVGEAVDSLLLGQWVFALTLATLCVFWFYILHRDMRRWPLGWPVLIKRYLGVLALQAAIWGVGLAWITPDDPTLLLTSLVLLLAILSGTPLSVSSHFPTLALYAVLTILPMGIRFMLNDNPNIQLLGWVSLPCLAIFIQAGWLLNRHLLEAYRAMERDATLVAELEHEKSVIHDALGQAEAANKAKSRFLAGASHDLRQPLQAIGLMVSALEREDSVEKRDVLVGHLSKSVGRLDRLFNRLLDISRLDSGKVPVRPVMSSSGEILQSLARQFDGIAADRGVPLRFKDAARATLHTDPDLLEQLLGNLVSNAIRYAPAGKVLVSARYRTMQGGKQLVFQVWDTGIGIEPGRHKDIFEEFVQLDNPAQVQTRGLGLGLAIARRTAVLLQAQLGVRSQPGRGSVFEVSLPCEPATDTAPDGQGNYQVATGLPSPKNTAQALLGAAPLAGVYALVVDDEPDILTGLVHGLGRIGCYVKSARNLAETRQWLDATERLPDALIVDYRLAHGETAWDIVRAVEQACGGPIAVLIITGEINPELDAKAARLAYPVLRKPVSIVTLEAHLQTALKNLEPAEPAEPAEPTPGHVTQTGSFSPLLAKSKIA